MPTPARADVVVQIDKSSQRMAVSVDGMTRYNRPVSTGRSGYGDPAWWPGVAWLRHPRVATLFALVKRNGSHKTRIEISN